MKNGGRRQTHRVQSNAGRTHRAHDVDTAPDGTVLA
jgi:hypothetical protein